MLHELLRHLIDVSFVLRRGLTMDTAEALAAGKKAAAIAAVNELVKVNLRIYLP